MALLTDKPIAEMTSEDIQFLIDRTKDYYAVVMGEYVKDEQLLDRLIEHHPCYQAEIAQLKALQANPALTREELAQLPEVALAQRYLEAFNRQQDIRLEKLADLPIPDEKEAPAAFHAYQQQNLASFMANHVLAVCDTHDYKMPYMCHRANSSLSFMRTPTPFGGDRLSDFEAVTTLSDFVGEALSQKHYSEEKAGIPKEIAQSIAPALSAISAVGAERYPEGARGKD